MLRNEKNEFNMIKCRKCGCVYHWSIKKCPECGCAQHSFYQRPLFYIVLVIVVVISLFKFGVIDASVFSKIANRTDSLKENFEMEDKNHEVNIESGTIVKQASGELLYPFSVTNDTKENCFVYLNDLVNDNDCSLFVKSGDTISIQMPRGAYEVYYCLGNKWYGEEELFGYETEAYQANTKVEFYDDVQGYLVQHKGYSLTIYQSAGYGNNQKIPRASFPN